MRRLRGEWMVAAIRPAGRPAGTWVLPKGMLEPGESSEAAALREVTEETGARGRTQARLGSLEYWFRDGEERVLKTVAFFLMRYEHGRLGRVAEASRHEVAEVRWLQLAEALHDGVWRGLGLPVARVDRPEPGVQLQGADRCRLAQVQRALGRPEQGKDDPVMDSSVALPRRNSWIACVNGTSQRSGCVWVCDPMACPSSWIRLTTSG